MSEPQTDDTTADLCLPAVAEAAKRIVATAGGAEDLAARLEPALIAARPEIEAGLARRVYRQLVESYRSARPRSKQQIDVERATLNCRSIAESMLAEADYFPRLARWVAINLCFWLWEGDSSDSIDGASVGSLIRVYTEGSAQAVVEMLSPPKRPIRQIEDILGLSSPAAGLPALGDIPHGMLPVVAADQFHRLREALYKKSFGHQDGIPWPTAPLAEDGRTYAQLLPAEFDTDPDPFRTKTDAWVAAMWRQQSELSDRDADALDALCALYLSQAQTPDDTAVADIDQILALRGLKPKVGGAGRRGGYEAEQREEVRLALTRIQNLWLTVAEVADAQTAVTRTMQSRPFIITERIGQTRPDGTQETERFIFRPGRIFAAFLFGGGRQLLFHKVLQYDPYRKKWEKRLGRHLSWRWGMTAALGEPAQCHGVDTLLDAVGEPPNARYPAKTRARFEQALATLLADGIIAGWRYAAEPAPCDRRNWLADWLATQVIIEAPASLKDYYANQRRLIGPSALGARMSEHRRTHHLTQMEAAQQLGIKQAHLSKIEGGKAVPSERLRQAIEEWLEE